MASCGTITVGSAFNESDVSASCNVQDSNITEGDTAVVDVTVSNSNDVGADYTVDLLVDGSQTASENGSVGSNSDDTTSFEIVDLSEGDHSIDVDLVEATRR